MAERGGVFDKIRDLDKFLQRLILLSFDVVLLSREMNPTSLTNDHLVAGGGLPLQKIQFNSPATNSCIPAVMQPN